MDHIDKQTLIALLTCAEEGDEDCTRQLYESFEAALKAEQTGEAEAQYDHAMYYDYGFGMKTNEKLASKWFEKAATQGHRASF